jgi:hypothetical protein
MKIIEITEDTELGTSRKELHHTDVTKRIPELTVAAEKLAKGEIDREEYQRLVNKYKRIDPYSFIPIPASDEEMHNALHVSKREKLNQPIEDGRLVKLRLDIPAYSSKGVWIPTVHDGKTGSTIRHGSTAVINNVVMQLPEKGALNIARGHSDTGKKIDKTPIATLIGSWENVTPEQAKTQAQQALLDPNWIQVGMDPERHSYFYNRSTQEPVIGGDRAIQVGGLVLVKNPKYSDKSKFMYES